ncbi:hypothetical protein BMS3Bbin03_00473 [bacterium BMS3Bbin03]|nr:hypothetical protein BMS3Bbin03_00473 [bacterium BMS3Bbin03]
MVAMTIGCSKKSADKGTAPLTQNYVPFKIGNLWTYRVTPSDSGSAYTATQEIVGSSKINGHEVVVMEIKNTQDPENWTKQFFQVSNNALLLYGWQSYDAVKGDTAKIFFPDGVQWVTLPFEENKTWSIYRYTGSLAEAPLVGSVLPSADLDGDGKPDRVVLAITGKSYSIETIQAAGKSFQAYKIDITINATVTLSQTHLTVPYTLKFGTFWFVPEVGIVKMAQYDFYGKPTDVWLLESYSLKG